MTQSWGADIYKVTLDSNDPAPSEPEDTQVLLCSLSLNFLICEMGLKYKTKTSHNGVFPGGPDVKNLPCNARDMGLIPGQRTKISHASGQLSPLAATTELLSHS